MKTINKKRWDLLTAAQSLVVSGFTILGLWVSAESAQDPIEQKSMQVANAHEYVGPDWTDTNQLWDDPQPISPADLETWGSAVAQLGDNTSCGYTRITAPCEDCGGHKGYPRASIEAFTHSLVKPGIYALGAWFDTPVMHDTTQWSNEQFDPRSDNGWALVAMNGAEPTPRQVKSYSDEKSATVNRLRLLQEKGDFEGSEMHIKSSFHPAAARLDLDSRAPTVKLGEDGDMLYLGTPPDRRGENPLARKTQVTWTLDRKDGSLHSVDQRAPKPFYAHFGLYVGEYFERIQFAHDPVVDASVVTNREYKFDTKLTFLFPTTNHVQHWYMDFQCPTEAG